MSSNPSLAGPVFRPLSGGKPRQLIVLLHGLGADGQDLIGLAPYWAQALPDAEFMAPHAPFPCDMAPCGHQWFSLQDRDPETVLSGVRAVAPSLEAFLDAELAKRDLDGRALALAGFSQGAMMALHVGLRRPVPPAALIGFSGALVGPAVLADEIRVRPPVLLIHGDADDIVPVTLLPAAVQALKAAGVPVESRTQRGLGHGIDEDGLRTAAAFLQRAFG
jgi:phospholipase/carboxylesterase